MKEECFICMENTETNPVRCIGTRLVHETYYACASCKREWYIRQRRCIVCNLEDEFTRAMEVNRFSVRHERQHPRCVIFGVLVVILYLAFYITINIFESEKYD